jgi:murein L,D-transpeptidase YafK
MSTQVSNRTYRQLAASGGILDHRTKRSRLLALCGALLIAFGGLSPARSSPPVLRADAILIVKHERKLYLMRDNYPLRSYRIALGLSPTGAKEHQWDFRTPEGSYIIDFRQEHSHYYKALHVSYPSPPDLKRSSALHLPAGGSIFIHGEPNRPSKPMDYYKTKDWTNGCIALSNEDLQEVWELTAGRTPVEIVP